MDSRSSSPETPETSDAPNNVTIHHSPPSWYIAKDVSAISVWDGDPFQKPDDEHMLKLDDIIQEHAYDEYAHPCVSLSPAYTGLQLCMLWRGKFAEHTLTLRRHSARASLNGTPSDVTTTVHP